ncbi:hypothetical protein JVU11DRAFT_5379 [Chiua virens]|nr:hypothetical protein JVU11DRAFT_5379 [Chiua virens]
MSDSTNYASQANGDPQSSQLSELLCVSSTTLRQALDLVDNVLTKDDQLTVQSKYLPGSTIGKHLRHARDHFMLLIDCILGTQPYVLSYDVRNRNTPMESSLSEAHNALVFAISHLKELESSPSISLDQIMTLNAVTPFSHTFETTFGRELWFAALHAVHHWSMVRVIAGEMDMSLPDDFGFAPSTLMYKGSDGFTRKGQNLVE